jgi:hypothetical protein
MGISVQPGTNNRSRSGMRVVVNGLVGKAAQSKIRTLNPRRF